MGIIPTHEGDRKMTITTMAIAVFLLNIPFGFLRGGTQRFSKKWFLYIHAPIPLVIALRIYSGLGFKLYTFPIVMGAFFLGQLTGSTIYRVFYLLKGQQGNGKHSSQ